MNARERGFLLLTSHLGDPERPVLSVAQLRTLAGRAGAMEPPEQERELVPGDLVKLGYSREQAQRICALLEEEALLEEYLRLASRRGCRPLTWVSPGYPGLLRQRLGQDAPGVLWARGDMDVLNHPAVALVGSRDLKNGNRAFAEAVGRWAAEQGITLISGNARGADRAAQDACLTSGGRVVSIVADRLDSRTPERNLLYLSEDGFEMAFSPQRALSRNRCIHALGAMVFVAQCTCGKGGTWDGTVKNLRFGWSTVICFRDGSPASLALEQMGAYLLGMEELKDFSVPTPEEFRLF